MPSIPALGRQMQANLCEFEASLVYKASSRTASYTERHCLGKQNETNKQTKNQKKYLESQNEDSHQEKQMVTNAGGNMS